MSGPICLEPGCTNYADKPSLYCERHRPGRVAVERLYVVVFNAGGLTSGVEVFSTKEGALAYERDIAREEYDLEPELDGTVDWDKLSDLHESPYAGIWVVTKDAKTGEWRSSERDGLRSEEPA